jgi:hypothetical protein
MDCRNAYDIKGTFSKLKLGSTVYVLTEFLSSERFDRIFDQGFLSFIFTGTMLRILQIFLNSALLIVVITLAAEMLAGTHWQFSKRITDEAGIMLFLATLAIALVGSLTLNRGLLKNTVFNFRLRSNLKPQLAILLTAIAVLFLMAKQVLRIVVYYDLHLSQYHLAFKLPPALEPESWTYDGVSISGDGSQIVIFLFYILTVNVVITLYNAGLLRQKSVINNASVLNRKLVIARIVAGLLVMVGALLVFIAFCYNVQSFIKHLQYDGAILNSSNILKLVSIFLNSMFLGICGQWILRDGLNLRHLLNEKSSAP